MAAPPPPPPPPPPPRRAAGAGAGAAGAGAAAAGILHPALAPLLRAVQLQRVFDDSKTAV
jgi:hypothetical protein